MLGVQALVTGRVAEMGGRLRITIELVNGADGTQIWGAQYSSEVSTLAEVEAEASREIAERAMLTKGITIRPEAYQLLPRGSYHMRLYAPENSLRAADRPST